MRDYPELIHTHSDMQAQNDHYRPTTFRDEASLQFIAELLLLRRKA